MNDFDYDVMQKKRIARGAFHKVNGSKSKGCRLPHENLTKKELNKLNGEIKTVSMMQPIAWELFKGLASDLQEEYLDTQIKRFGVGLRTISRDLFGQSDQTLAHFVRQNGLDVVSAPDGRQPKTARESWNRWLNIGALIAPESETTTEPTPETTPIATKEPEPEVKPFRAHDHKADPLLQLFADCGLEREDKGNQSDDEGIIYPLTDLSLTLKGTPIDIITTLRMSFPALLDKDTQYRFTVKVDKYVL